ncbi:hypothetical protein BRC81_11370 [Halobacteriales archaeon QS_1_68_20]|nr:MAG: hypothetical protein BRC81_11370 [Halobacteriales archaeon QS_1_68_20]
MLAGLLPRAATDVAPVVVHRLSTVRDADRILVVDDGEVIEQGPGQVLLGVGFADFVAEASRRVTRPSPHRGERRGVRSTVSHAGASPAAGTRRRDPRG